MSISNKKLLKQLEGATIEKIEIKAGGYPAERKIKIKTNLGTVTVTFDDVIDAGDETGTTEVLADVSFKEPKLAPTAKPTPPLKVVTNWPFPTGNKP